MEDGKVYPYVHEIDIGTLVKVNGRLFTRVYTSQGQESDKNILGLMGVGPKAQNGHGYYVHSHVGAVHICHPSGYKLIPVEKGVISNDMGAPLSAEQLRAALDAGGVVPPDDCGGGSSPGRRRVHHCSSCCRCECHQRVRV